MTEDDIFDMFLDAIDTFPPEHQKVAQEWLVKVSAALSILNDLKKRVLA